VFRGTPVVGLQSVLVDARNEQDDGQRGGGRTEKVGGGGLWLCVQHGTDGPLARPATQPLQPRTPDWNTGLASKHCAQK
jgi:hypothetical protein